MLVDIGKTRFYDLNQKRFNIPDLRERLDVLSAPIEKIDFLIEYFSRMDREYGDILHELSDPGAVYRDVFQNGKALEYELKSRTTAIHDLERRLNDLKSVSKNALNAAGAKTKLQKSNLSVESLKLLDKYSGIEKIGDRIATYMCIYDPEEQACKETKILQEDRADIEERFRDIVNILSAEKHQAENYRRQLSSSPVYKNTVFFGLKRNNPAQTGDNPAAADTKTQKVGCRKYDNDSGTNESLELSDLTEYQSPLPNSFFETVKRAGQWRVEVTDCGNRADLNTGELLKASIPLRDLILPKHALKYFDQILIVDHKGRVLFRSGEKELSGQRGSAGFEQGGGQNDFSRFMDFSGLLELSETNVGSLSDSVAGTSNEISSANRSKGSGREADRYSRFVEKDIGDVSQFFFLQPMLPSQEQRFLADKEKYIDVDVWHVVGVVSKGRMYADAMSLYLNVTAALVLILLLIALSVPFLILRFASPSSFTGPGQLHLLATSLIMLVGVADVNPFGYRLLRWPKGSHG